MGGRARGATTLSLGQQRDQDGFKAAQQPSQTVPPEDLEPKRITRAALRTADPNIIFCGTNA
jgi:hypothetical protein